MWRRVLIGLLVLAGAILLLPESSPAADGDRPPKRDRVGRTPEQIFARWGPGVKPQAGSYVSNDPCVYKRGEPGLPVEENQKPFSYVDDEGNVWVWIYWQCGLPDDTTVDGQALVTVGERSLRETVDGAFAAEPWPALEIITGPNDVVVSGLPIGLRLEGETYEFKPTARANDGTLWVQATATATEVKWRMGGINSQFGGNDVIDCFNFGNRTPDPADSICNYTYASSSATTGGSVDLQAGILYTIEYTTNLPALAADVVRFGRPDFRYEILRPGYVVSEAQSVIVE